MSKIILAEQASAPDTPGSGKVAVYVDNNGDLAWKDAAGNINKIASAGGYTLTMTASGTPALYTTGNWTPAITGSASNPTVAYTTQTGRYTKIADIVYFDAWIVINTISSGSGDLRISLPVLAAASRYPNTIVYMSGVDMPGTPISIVGVVAAGQLYMLIDALQDNAAVQRMQISALAAGDAILITGWYFA